MKHSITIFMIVLYITVIPLAAGSYANRTSVPLQQGVLLVATPRLSDPNFIHTVILLVSYGKEGALGLIVNRPAGIHLKQALPDIEGIEKEIFPVYSGGPVNRDILFILFTSDEPPQGAQKIFNHLYFANRKDVIIPILQGQNIKNRVRVYAGYAGWAPGQLEHEIMQGAWITMEANLETVFTDDPYRIWPSIFKIPEDILVRIFTRKITRKIAKMDELTPGNLASSGSYRLVPVSKDGVAKMDPLIVKLEVILSGYTIGSSRGPSVELWNRL